MNRREFLKKALAGVGVLIVGPKLLAEAEEPMRLAHYENVVLHHTKALKASDPVVKRWAESLVKEAETKTYFREFMGTGENNIVQVKVRLNKHDRRF